VTQIKVSFVIDEDQLAPVTRAMRPFARAIMIEDADDEDIGPVISARKVSEVFHGTRPAAARKVRKTARRLRVTPVATQPSRPKGKSKSKSSSTNRPSKLNGHAPVTAAMVETVRKRGPMISKDLHDDMVRQGFGLQSSYNALFVAKKQNKLKIDNSGMIALGDA
jgi:hypothetical protein